MKSQVEKVLRDGLENARDDMRWTSESIARLRKEKGDPARIERLENIHFQAAETVIQIREMLEPVGDSAAPSQPQPPKCPRCGSDVKNLVSRECYQYLGPHHAWHDVATEAAPSVQPEPTEAERMYVCLKCGAESWQVPSAKLTRCDRGECSGQIVANPRRG